MRCCRDPKSRPFVRAFAPVLDHQAEIGIAIDLLQRLQAAIERFVTCCADASQLLPARFRAATQRRDQQLVAPRCAADLAPQLAEIEFLRKSNNRAEPIAAIGRLPCRPRRQTSAPTWPCGPRSYRSPRDRAAVGRGIARARGRRCRGPARHFLRHRMPSERPVRGRSPCRSTSRISATVSTGSGRNRTTCDRERIVGSCLLGRRADENHQRSRRRLFERLQAGSWRSPG